MANRNAYTHLGIIITLDVGLFRKIKPIEEKSYCTRWPCSMRHVPTDGNYCKECGDKLETDRNDKLTSYKLYQLFNGSNDYKYEDIVTACEATGLIFVYKWGGRKSLFDSWSDDCYAPIDLNVFDGETMLKEFKEENSEFINDLNEFFGESVVNVLFGIGKHW